MAVGTYSVGGNDRLTALAHPAIISLRVLSSANQFFFARATHEYMRVREERFSINNARVYEAR